MKTLPLYAGLNACIPLVFSPAGSHTSFIIATEINNRMPIVIVNCKKSFIIFAICYKLRRTYNKGHKKLCVQYALCY